MASPALPGNCPSQASPRQYLKEGQRVVIQDGFWRSDDCGEVVVCTRKCPAPPPITAPTFGPCLPLHPQRPCSRNSLRVSRRISEAAPSAHISLSISLLLQNPSQKLGRGPGADSPTGEHLTPQPPDVLQRRPAALPDTPSPSPYIPQGRRAAEGTGVLSRVTLPPQLPHLMLRPQRKTRQPGAAASVARAASSPNWEGPGRLTGCPEEALTQVERQLGVAQVAPHEVPQIPHCRRKVGKQAPHSRATPPPQWDEPSPTSVQTTPQVTEDPPQNWCMAGFLQVSCSPRPEAPILGIGEPTFSGCPSVPAEPRTVGAWRAPCPRGTAQLLCQASDESRSPALCPLPAPEPRRKEPGGVRGSSRPPGLPDGAAHRSRWGGRSPAGCSGQETGPSRPPRPGQAGLSAGQLEPNPGSCTPGPTMARPPLHWASTPSPWLPPETPGHGLEARTRQVPTCTCENTVTFFILKRG